MRFQSHVWILLHWGQVAMKFHQLQQKQQPLNTHHFRRTHFLRHEVHLGCKYTLMASRTTWGNKEGPEKSCSSSGFTEAAHELMPQQKYGDWMQKNVHFKVCTPGWEHNSNVNIKGAFLRNVKFSSGNFTSWLWLCKNQEEEKFLCQQFSTQPCLLPAARMVTLPLWGAEGCDVRNNQTSMQEQAGTISPSSLLVFQPYSGCHLRPVSLTPKF